MLCHYCTNTPQGCMAESGNIECTSPKYRKHAKSSDRSGDFLGDSSNQTIDAGKWFRKCDTVNQDSYSFQTIVTILCPVQMPWSTSNLFITAAGTRRSHKFNKWSFLRGGNWRSTALWMVPQVLLTCRSKTSHNFLYSNQDLSKTENNGQRRTDCFQIVFTSCTGPVQIEHGHLDLRGRRWVAHMTNFDKRTAQQIDICL